jgi:hypothetical protein
MAARLTNAERALRAVTEANLRESIIGRNQYGREHPGEAQTRGWSCWYQPQTRRQVVDHRTGGSKWVGATEARGEPDVRLAHPGQGRYLAVELKRERGELSPGQVQSLDVIACTQVEVFVWRPRHRQIGLVDDPIGRVLQGVVPIQHIDEAVAANRWDWAAVLVGEYGVWLPPRRRREFAEHDANVDAVHR